MKYKHIFYAAIFSLLFIHFTSEDILAQDRGKFGIRTGIYTDLSDMFIGAEYLAPIGHSVYLNPNIEYIFIENGNFWTFNIDAHYDFPTSSNVFVWTGGGLGILHINPEGPPDGSTDAALNLLFGVGFNTYSNLIPYIQGKAIVSDNTDFELGFGLRF